jgi:hypothetical protein
MDANYMDVLHEALAKALTESMKAEPSAAVYDVVRRFLADNNVAEDGLKKGPAKSLAAELPFVLPEENPFQ